MEALMKSTFGADAYLDVTKVTARFDFAALTGKMVGLNQCKLFYGRCKIPYADMKNLLEIQFNYYNL